MDDFFMELLDAVYEVYICETEAMCDDDLDTEYMDFYQFFEDAVDEQERIYFCIYDSNEECAVEY